MGEGTISRETTITIISKAIERIISIGEMIDNHTIGIIQGARIEE